MPKWVQKAIQIKQKTIQKTHRKRMAFFYPKRSPLVPRSSKSVQNAPYICKLKKNIHFVRAWDTYLSSRRGETQGLFCKSTDVSDKTHGFGAARSPADLDADLTQTCRRLPGPPHRLKPIRFRMKIRDRLPRDRGNEGTRRPRRPKRAWRCRGPIYPLRVPGRGRDRCRIPW